MKKVQIEISGLTFEVNRPENLSEAVRLWGEDKVFLAVEGFVALRQPVSVARAVQALQQAGKDEATIRAEIEPRLNVWKPGETIPRGPKGVRKAKALAKLAEKLAVLSPEDRRAVFELLKHDAV